MKTRDYLLAALKANAYDKRDWVISAMAVTSLSETPVQDYPYQLFAVGKKYAFLDLETQQPVVIEDSDISAPLLNPKQKIVLLPNELLNVQKETVTTIGNVIFNYVALVIPFGSKIPFQTGKVDIGKLEKQIVKLVEDVPADGKRRPDRIYWDELQLYVKYGLSLGGLETLCVPTGSIRNLTPHPQAAALRKKLIEERKDRLDDPAVIAEITKELEALDREWIDSDPDKGYYVKNKSFQVVRMRKYGIFGAEKDLVNGGTVLIEKPLVEGYDPQTLPVAITSSRDGSFSRGAMTAMGGDQVKKMLRTTSGIGIPEEDCGSTLGIPTVISESLIGHSVVIAGKSILLTTDNIGSYVGKELIRRSPATCKTGPNDYCMTCMGEFIRDRRDAVGLVVSQVGSQMMLVRMGAMHGKALMTKSYEYLDDIS